MKTFFKYAAVLVLGLAIGFYIHKPVTLAEAARLARFDEINNLINKVVESAKPAPAVNPIDPTRAALVDEELDYRIAQRAGSLDGWRSFLAAHPRGIYAQNARAAFEKLLVAEKAAPPLEAQAPERPKANADDKIASLDPSVAAQPAPVLALMEHDETLAPADIEASISGNDKTANDVSLARAVPDKAVTSAAPSSEDACTRDEERLDRLRGNNEGDGLARFVEKLSCERLRPQVLALVQDDRTTAPAPEEPVQSVGGKAANQAAGPRSAPAQVVEGAAPSPEPICERDEEHLKRLRESNASDAVARFASELGCERLRPQVLALLRRLNSRPSAAAPEVPPAKTKMALGPQRRAAEVGRTRSIAASEGLLHSKGHVSRCGVRSSCVFKPLPLPPILLALMGERPRHPYSANSAFPIRR